MSEGFPEPADDDLFDSDDDGEDVLSDDDLDLDDESDFGE